MVVKYEVGPQSLQDRASTVPRGPTRKGEVSGNHVAGGKLLGCRTCDLSAFGFGSQNPTGSVLPRGGLWS
jgi:hypothetical protein